MTSTTTAPALGPVSLPAASYDLAKLSKGLGHAASLKSDEARSDAVAAALKDASEGEIGGKPIDPSSRIDQERRKVTREDLGVTENVLVSIPDTAPAKADEPVDQKITQAPTRAPAGEAGK